MRQDSRSNEGQSGVSLKDAGWIKEEKRKEKKRKGKKKWKEVRAGVLHDAEEWKMNMKLKMKKMKLKKFDKRKVNNNNSSE